MISPDQSSVGGNKNTEMVSIKKRQTKTRDIPNQSKCDSPKKSKSRGRKLVDMENETVKRSAVVQTQIMYKPIEIETISKKEHRRVTKQNLKKAQMDMGQKKDRGNMVLRSSRNCKVVKVVRDVSSENQKKRVNTEEKQAQEKP